jgi:hypothetical protein
MQASREFWGPSTLFFNMKSYSNSDSDSLDEEDEDDEVDVDRNDSNYCGCNAKDLSGAFCDPSYRQKDQMRKEWWAPR